jgi:Tfp pilus assembly protein PilV
MSTDTEARPVEPALPVKRPNWTPWIIALAAVLVVVGVLAGVLVSRNSVNQVSSQQLAELQQACSQWKVSSSDPATPSDWCTNMIGWMSDRMDDHPGMWASPGAMQATCQEWSAADPGAASEGYRIAWCDDMVSWMQQHAAHWGSWNGWMMHGPMMG